MKRHLYSIVAAFFAACLLASCCNMFTSAKKVNEFNAYHEKLIEVCNRSDDFFNKDYVPYVDKIPSKVLEGDELKAVQDKIDAFVEDYSKIRDDFKAIAPEKPELMDMHREFIDYADKRMEALELVKKGFERDKSFIVVLEEYKKLLDESEVSLKSFADMKKAYFEKYNLVEK